MRTNLAGRELANCGRCRRHGQSMPSPWMCRVTSRDAGPLSSHGRRVQRRRVTDAPHVDRLPAPRTDATEAPPLVARSAAPR